LNWIALTPRQPVSVTLDGEMVEFIAPGLPTQAAAELRWVWAALQTATRAQAAAVFYRGVRVMQAGVAPTGCTTPAQPALGPICEAAQATGTANYFANLALYPGRFEFFNYMPVNSQVPGDLG
jgi:hypothetical protein